MYIEYVVTIFIFIFNNLDLRNNIVNKTSNVCQSMLIEH